MERSKASLCSQEEMSPRDFHVRVILNVVKWEAQKRGEKKNYKSKGVKMFINDRRKRYGRGWAGPAEPVGMCDYRVTDG